MTRNQITDSGLYSSRSPATQGSVLYNITCSLDNNKIDKKRLLKALEISISSKF